MGAWGRGPFENDSALDWVGELEESEDISILGDAFDAIPRADEEYIEVDEASAAIAAAEVVAAMAGRSMATALPGEVQTWMAGKPKPKPPLIKKAIRAVQRVLKSSELQELWEESGAFAEWGASVDELVARLSSTLPAK